MRLLVWELSRATPAGNEGLTGTLRSDGPSSVPSASPSPPPSPRADSPARGGEDGSATGPSSLAASGSSSGGSDAGSDTPLPVWPKSSEQRARLAAACGRVLLFRQLSTVAHEAALDAMFERRVEDGETVIRQGDEGDNFYVVESGTFDCFVSKEGSSPKLVTSYGPGGTFGELALLRNAPRAATVTARGEGSLWAVRSPAYRALLLYSRRIL